MILDRLPPESAKCSPRGANGFCNSLSFGNVFFFKRCSGSQSIGGGGGGGGIKKKGAIFPFFSPSPDPICCDFFRKQFSGA